MLQLSQTDTPTFSSPEQNIPLILSYSSASHIMTSSMNNKTKFLLHSKTTNMKHSCIFCGLCTPCCLGESGLVGLQKQMNQTIRAHSTVPLTYSNTKKVLPDNREQKKSIRMVLQLLLLPDQERLVPGFLCLRC